LAGAGTNTEAAASGDPLRRHGERRMSSRESLPVPLFDWLVTPPGAEGSSRRAGRKYFFFEKKKQKTFVFFADATDQNGTNLN
jgi:hypothetical protein